MSTENQDLGVSRADVAEATRPRKAWLVVEMADGKKRKYSVAASVAEKRLAQHHEAVATFGTAHLYKNAYVVMR